MPSRARNLPKFTQRGSNGTRPEPSPWPLCLLTQALSPGTHQAFLPVAPGALGFL